MSRTFYGGMIGGLIGGLIGPVASFFITYYYCVYLDWQNPSAPSGGYVAIGWIYLFITVPIGFLVGILVGATIGAVTARRSSPISSKSNGDE